MYMDESDETLNLHELMPREAYLGSGSPAPQCSKHSNFFLRISRYEKLTSHGDSSLQSRLSNLFFKRTPDDGGAFDACRRPERASEYGSQQPSPSHPGQL